jgi:GT2 family glycosyltransferase
MKQTAIVILNWNGKNLLEDFLPKLMEYTPLDEADIVVADNASTDDSLTFLKKQYPKVIIQTFKQNYGFAEGYNRALANLDYKYVVLLNSDVEVSKNWFQPAIDYLEKHEEIAALQPKILSYRDKTMFEYAGASGGFLDIYGYPFCRGRILNTIEKDLGQYDEPQLIFWASGACLFIRLEEFKQAGGFDPVFFAHQEEIDLCWRLNAKGKKIVCFPQSVVYHVGAATLNQEHPGKTYLNFRNNLLMIYKNLPDYYYKKVIVVRFFTDYLAALHLILKGKFKNAFSVYEARKDFHHLKAEYTSIRKENLKSSLIKLPEPVLKKSILWQYYIRNKKKYNQL